MHLLGIETTNKCIKYLDFHQSRGKKTDVILSKIIFHFGFGGFLYCDWLMSPKKHIQLIFCHSSRQLWCINLDLAVYPIGRVIKCYTTESV